MTCASCHGDTHLPPSRIIPERTCGRCHGEAINDVQASAHGDALSALVEPNFLSIIAFTMAFALFAISVGGSALAFTIHHVFALKAQFGWSVTLIASLGIFIGGGVWSWMYARYRSIWPGYVSHAIVDVAVFAIGWMLIFG